MQQQSTEKQLEVGTNSHKNNTMANISSDASVVSTITTATAASSALGNNIGNFDVLLAYDHDVGRLCLDTAQHHVGNSRFEVMMNMHRQDYQNKHSEGADTSEIVHKLISIVNKECVPPGKFLQSSHQNKSSAGEEDEENMTVRWSVVPEHDVVEFIEQSLQPTESSSSDNPQQQIILANPPSNSEEAKLEETAKFNNGEKQESAEETGIHPRDEKKTAEMRASRRVSFRDMEPLTFSEDIGGGPLAMPSTGEPDLPPPPFPKGDAADEEKKRRRRSSLLSRSLSDQMSSFVRDMDIKKKMNRTTEERRPSLWRIFGKKQTVQRPQALDVVFVAEAVPDHDGHPVISALLENHTGNNRLKVMMQMDKDRYANSAIDARSKMLKQWIDTVGTHWKGKFLLQKQEEDPLLEEMVSTFMILDAGQAEKGLGNIMDEMIPSSMSASMVGRELGTLFERSGEFSTEFSSDLRSEDPSSDFKRIPTRLHRASSASTVATAPARTGGHSPPPQQRKSKGRFNLQNIGRSFSTASMRRQSSVSTASAATMPEPPQMNDMQGMRNAAVESLQRRKKRQGLATRIHRLAENTLRRSSVRSAAPANAETSDNSSTSPSLLGRFSSSFRRNSKNTQNSTTPGSGSVMGPPAGSIPTTLNAPVAASARRPSYMSTSSLPRTVMASRRTSYMSASSVSTMGDGSSRNFGDGSSRNMQPEMSEDVIEFSNDRSNGNFQMPSQEMRPPQNINITEGQQYMSTMPNNQNYNF